MGDITLGSLVISRFIMLPAMVKNGAGSLASALEPAHHKRVRLTTYHGVQRSECEEMVENFARCNGFKPHDLQCEWICRDYI